MIDIGSDLMMMSCIYYSNVLLAIIEPDYKNRQRIVNFTFVPIGDEQLDSISLLQFYVSYPFEIDKKYKNELVKFLRTYALGRYGAGKARTISTSNLINSFGLRKSYFYVLSILKYRCINITQS